MPVSPTQHQSLRELARTYDRTAPYWDSFVQRGVYGRAYTRLFEQLRPWLRRDADGGTLRALDCGTGCGLLLTSLAKVMDGRSMEMFGVDLSSKMLEYAQRQPFPRGSAPKFLLADICSLPFRDGEMDLVGSALALEHVAEPVEALREMIRVARPGASLILVATRPHAPDLPYRLIFHYKPFQTGQLSAWMEQAGIPELRSHPLTGIARLFGHAFVGKKPG